MTDDLVEQADVFRLGTNPADREVYIANWMIVRMTARIGRLEAENARLRDALTGIRRLARLVANDLQGRVESGKVAAVQNCADIADAALNKENPDD